MDLNADNLLQEQIRKVIAEEKKTRDEIASYNQNMENVTNNRKVKDLTNKLTGLGTTFAQLEQFQQQLKDSGKHIQKRKENRARSFEDTVHGGKRYLPVSDSLDSINLPADIS